MTQEIEIEYKNLLTKNEFNHILYSLPFQGGVQTQTNHYFETTNFSLKEKGCALRIREKNSTYTLTLKEPHSTGLLETHDVMTVNEASEWMSGAFHTNGQVKKQLADKNISLEDLLYCGSLTTRRRELEYEDVLLVLDYSTYGNSADYELEIEAKSEESGRKKIAEVLERFDIQKRDTPNKIQRFFAAMGSL